MFVKCFQTTDLAAKYLTKIEAVQQTGSAASYANQFLECLTYLDWTKETKLTQFNRGLKPDLLRTLAITKCKSTLDKWIAVIILADNNLFKIDQELKHRGINKPAQTSKSVQSNTANSQSSAKVRDTCPPNPLPTTTTTTTVSSMTLQAVPMDVDATCQSCPCKLLTEAKRNIATRTTSVSFAE